MIKTKIPIKHKIKAAIQWSSVASVLLFVCAIGFVMALLAALTSKKMKNDFGEKENSHILKYINQGSSHIWHYMASPVPIIRLWSNYEDGDLGEPSGKHSVRCGGNERSLWNRYKWLAFRNPFNMGKRTIPFFHCIVEECDIEYWGDEYVSDKHLLGNGRQFVMATHRKTGKKYYGFYSVKLLSKTEVRVWKVGFKIKPSHAGVIQDADDKDKAFTFRYQHSSEIN